MFCTKCGKEIPENEKKMCKNCQKKFKNELADGEYGNSKINNIQSMYETIKKNKVICITLIIVVAITLFLLMLNKALISNTGNTVGNIRNYGYSAESGDWMYFILPNKNNTELGIYKMKKGDSKQKTKTELAMNNWDVLSINVLGDYVYFIGILPGYYSEEDEVNNKIYRMGKDGSNLQVINDNDFDNECYEIYVVKDKVYYMGKDYNIYKMNIDGSNREMVLNNGTGYLGITENYIVYNVESEKTSDYVTYIADINGENERPIIEDTRLYSVNIDDDYIYYTNNQKYICRVKIDGTKQEVLYEETAYTMNKNKNYIYYLNYIDEENSDNTVGIYRVKANSSSARPELIKKLDTSTPYLNILEDWIFYKDANQEESFLGFLKINGKEEIKVYSINYEEYYNLTQEDVEDSEEEESNTDVTGNEGNAENSSEINNSQEETEEQDVSENVATE